MRGTEPWRGCEGESVAQVGKDAAFLGQGLKAGLREDVAQATQ